LKVLPAKSSKSKISAQSQALDSALDLDLAIISEEERLRLNQLAIAQKAADSIAEYQQLKQRLLFSTLGIASLGFAIASLNYGLNIGLNYLLGACVGALYLRQLAKSVDSIGASGGGFQGLGQLGSPRIALFVGLIIVATRWHQLSLLPVFLGFLTYKAAILIYAIQIFFADSD
jgi:ATP synthase protein I